MRFLAYNIYHKKMYPGVSTNAHGIHHPQSTGNSKITADGDCSHEIKRHLLLGRNVMTNLDKGLDSILKSRDVTWTTKVRLVKAMVFPVVVYGCESWTVKNAERQRIDAFEPWC